ncbi:MAG: hypothetical protein RLZZ241_617 [Bacteroidota bacterium]|jgi:hypothetical protein
MAQYETQKFTKISDFFGVELRYYPPTMKIQSPNDFRSLFGFISGKNSQNLSIKMTTPVYMGDSEGNPVMEFVLPRTFDPENTPKSNSDYVRVFQSKPGYFLATTFDGFGTETRRKKFSDKLIREAKNQKLEILGKPIFLAYNSPYKLIGRKNEMLLEVAYNMN